MKIGEGEGDGRVPFIGRGRLRGRIKLMLSRGGCELGADCTQSTPYLPFFRRIEKRLKTT